MSRGSTSREAMQQERAWTIQELAVDRNVIHHPLSIQSLTKLFIIFPVTADSDMHNSQLNTHYKFNLDQCFFSWIHFTHHSLFSHSGIVWLLQGHWLCGHQSRGLEPQPKQGHHTSHPTTDITAANKGTTLLTQKCVVFSILWQRGPSALHILFVCSSLLHVCMFYIDFPPRAHVATNSVMQFRITVSMHGALLIWPRSQLKWPKQKD